MRVGISSKEIGFFLLSIIDIALIFTAGFLIFGLIIMIIAEYFFIKTGVETFNRNSLVGVMPLWLPFLWGYAFIAIKRAIGVLK